MRPPPDQFADALAHADWVRHLARSLVSEADAEDLAQDTWEATLRADGTRHRGWLRGVLANLASLQHRATARRLRREASALVTEAPPSADVVLERLELQRLLSTLVSELPEPTRTVLFLRFYEGLDATAIGERLSLPPGTVRWRLKQGLDALREQLDARLGGRERWALVLLPLASVDAPLSLLPGALMKAKHVVAGSVVVALALLGGWWWPASPRGTQLAGDATPPTTAHPRGLAPAPELEAAAGAIPTWATQPGAPPRRVAGRVLRAGTPVARARVLLTLKLQPSSAAPQERWTGDDGSFDFGSQRPAEVAISAAAPGSPSTFLELDLRNPQSAPRPEALELTLATRCEAWLVGRVLDSGAGAVPTATVRERYGSAAHADANGDFELCLSPGKRTVLVEAPGYGAVQLGLWLSGRTRRDLVLAPEATLAGTVLDAATDAPVAEAMVWAMPARYEGEDTARPAMVLSDARGRFRLGVAPGDYRLFALAGGTARSPIEIVSAAVGAANDQATLRVRPGVEVRGVVRASGQPVAGAHVMAFNLATGQSVDGFSQADGRFTLEGASPGDQIFTAAPWKVEQPRRWRAAVDAPEVELLVSRQASLHGVVTRNHRPVAGARVGVALSLQEFAATSDAQGRYLLEGLPRGTFHLVASSDTAGAFVELPGLTLKADEDRELDLELVSASSIEGTVVDERGAPLAGALVVFTNETKDDEGRDTTSTDGRFRCTQMRGGSTYAPEVFVSGRPGVAAKPVGAFPRVVVRDGDAHLEGVRLQVKVEKLPLAGRVVDASGAPVPDAKVRAQSVEPGERAVFSAWQPLAQAFSDAQGRFSFEGLSSGSWAVQARSPQGDEVVVEARAGSTDVVLTLRTAARIEGKLVDFSQPPSVYAQQPGASLVPGQVRGDSFSLTLPAGTWTLSAMDNQEGDAQRVTLAEGEVKRVVMTSRGTGKVRARVVDHDTGLPVPDLICHLVLAAGDKPGVTNWSLESAPVTDADGRFEQDPAPAGHVAVACLSDWRVMSSASRIIDLARGQTADVTLEVVRRTQGPHGNPGCGFEQSVPRVAQLAKGGAAERAGLQVGDLVVALDGKPADGLDASGVATWLENHPPGAVVELTVVGQGQARTVRLAL